MKRAHLFTAAMLIAVIGGGLALAQTRTMRSGTRGMRSYEEMARPWGDTPPRTARETEQHSVPTPAWTNSSAFAKDVFTFARIQYAVNGAHGFGHTPPQDRWAIDFPDSDLNFSYRLQQMTAIKADPDCRVIKITDKDLTDYPFLYIVEPGRLTFTDEEVSVLRRYLLNGGFLMFDDFWCKEEYDCFYNEIKKVFPEREPADLPLEHPIFHCVFELSQKPQVPGLPWGIESELTGITWEQHRLKTACDEVHYRGISDDKGRLMVMICHNTDLGDGWEREGENEFYFKEYAEKWAYPLGINIVFYAMTH